MHYNKCVTALMVIALACMPFVLAVSIGNSGVGWTFDYIQEDQYIHAGLNQLGDNVLNLSVGLREGVSESPYWYAVICDPTGEDPLEVLIEGLRHESASYGYLAESGLPLEWCSESKGQGFILPGSGGDLPFNLGLLLSDSINQFMLYAGSGTEIINATGQKIATRIGPNENIVRDSSGNLHATWIGEGSDLYYGSSSDDGIDWSTLKIIGDAYENYSMKPFSCDNVGILANSNNDLFVYYTDTVTSPIYELKIVNSTDGGATWNSHDLIFPNREYKRGSCALSPNDVIHCCGINSTGSLHYTNSTQFGSITEVNNNEADDTDYCDIEVDSNGVVYIVGIGSDDADVDLWTSSVGWGSSNRITVDSDVGNSVGDGQAPTIAVYQNKIYIAYTKVNQLWFANLSSQDVSHPTIREVDSSYSLFPDVGVNNLGDIHIIYQDNNVVNDYTTSYHSYSLDHGETWIVREQLHDTSGFGSVADSNYPASNKMGTTLRYVFTNSSGTVLFNTLAYDNCVPPTSRNWNIRLEDNCVNTVERNLQGYNITITGEGSFVTTARIYNITYLEVKSDVYNVSCKGGCFET